jgi:hypothetical protein
MPMVVPISEQLSLCWLTAGLNNANSTARIPAPHSSRSSVQMKQTISRKNYSGKKEFSTKIMSPYLTH